MLTHYIDIFPINTTIPEFYAYKLNFSNKENKEISWQVAYKLQSYLPTSIWCALPQQNLLITDKAIGKTQLGEMINQLWKEHKEKNESTFRNITNINPESIEKNNPHAQAAYTKAYVKHHFEKEINTALKKEELKEEKIIIRKTFYLKDYVINNQPHLGIAISSTMYLKDGKLSKWIEKHKEQSIKGLLVRDIHTNNKGFIIKEIGILKDHRNRLLALATKTETKKAIQNASDNELIIQIQKKTKTYDYIASSLYIIVETKTASRLGINNALNKNTIQPKKRAELVDQVAEIIKTKGWINQERISSSKYATNFKTKEDIKFEETYKLGSKEICTNNDKYQVVKQLSTHGLYEYKSKKIQMAVLTLLEKTEETKGENFLKALKKELKNMKFEVSSPTGEFFRLSPNENSFEQEFSETIEKIKNEKPAIILVLLPRKSYTEKSNELYQKTKKALYREDIHSQFIFEEKVKNSNSLILKDTALGILAKTGNTPWVLGKPLEYADMIAGLDVASQDHERKEGSTILVATAHFYANEGKLERYIRTDQPIEGETIPKDVLHNLLPEKYCGKKKIIIHRDGRFPIQEKHDLYDWGKKINTTFYLVEVIKKIDIRLYTQKTWGEKENPEKGLFFTINEKEAILSTSRPYGGTAKPLYIKADEKLSLEEAIHSVLSMTLLHYGSSKSTPRLPVTTYYSDKIGNLALKGIKPNSLEGTLPYWL